MCVTQKKKKYFGSSHVPRPQHKRDGDGGGRGGRGGSTSGMYETLPLFFASAPPGQVRRGKSGSKERHILKCQRTFSIVRAIFSSPLSRTGAGSFLGDYSYSSSYNRIFPYFLPRIPLGIFELNSKFRNNSELRALSNKQCPSTRRLL